MSVLNLDLEKVAEFSGQLQRITSSIQDYVTPLAALVAEPTNELQEELGERCRVMQNSYNESLVTGTADMLEEMGKFEELKAAVAKGAQGLVATKKVEADMNVSAIDIPQL